MPIAAVPIVAETAQYSPLVELRSFLLGLELVQIYHVLQVFDNGNNPHLLLLMTTFLLIKK